MSIQHYAKEARQRKRAAKPRIANVKLVGLGPEPNVELIVAGREDYKSKLTLAMNWIHYAVDYSKLKKMSVDMLRDAEQNVDWLGRVPDYEFGTYGKLAWMQLGGAVLDETETNWMARHLAQLQTKYPEPVVGPNPVVRVLTQAELVERATSAAIATLDAAIDEGDFEFNAPQLMRGKNVDTVRVKAYFQKLNKELGQVKSDEQVKEAYQGMKPANVRKMKEFVETIVEFKTRIAKAPEAEETKPEAPATEKAPVVAKVRAKKVKTAVEQVKDLQVVRTFEGLNGAAPTEIVNAKQVVIFNTKSNKVDVYIAKVGTVLSVKGRKIKDFDVALSYKKKLRKPVEQLAKLMKEPGSKGLNKALDEIKSKKGIPNGSVNEFCMVVKKA